MSREPIPSISVQPLAEEATVSLAESSTETTKYQSDPYSTEKGISEEDNASALTFLGFSWVTPMLQRGYQRVKEQQMLENNDILGHPKDLNTVENYKRFAIEWQAEVDRVNAMPPPPPGKPVPLPSVVTALRRSIGGQIWIGAVLRFFSDASSIAIPFLLQFFIRWMRDYVADPIGTPEGYGFMWACILILVQYFNACLTNFSHHFTIRAFLKGRDVLTVAIFEKAMKLEATHRLSGNIVTMHSTDTFKLVELGPYFQGLWSAPIVIVGALIALYFFIGWAGILSLGAIAILTPIQIFASGQMMRLRGAINSIADTRLRAVSELLSGIRVIKFMSWEKEVQRKISETRQREVDRFIPFFVARSVVVALLSSQPPLIVFTVISIAYGFGETIEPSVVFPVIAMLNVLRLPLSFLPLAIGKSADVAVSLGRIRDFLLTQEKIEFVEQMEEPEYMASSAPDEKIPVAIRFKDADLQVYNENDRSRRTTLLHGVDLNIPEGRLTIIVGATGSGKSTLINAIAGEGLLGPGGRIARSGSIAFVAQEAWIMNNTVQNNILMGKPFDKQRYVETVNKCQLMQDLEQLDASDQTEIGERGINLSGGQKQRIAFARAVYSGIPLVLMDDPLSAVDAHVRVALFDDVICDALADRTRVLVTHYVEYLPQADHIIIVADKKVAFSGSYAELQQADGVDLQAIVENSVTPQSSTPSSKVAIAAAEPLAGSPPAALSDQENRKAKYRDEIPPPRSRSCASPEGSPSAETTTKQKPNALMSQENQAVGKISSHVFGWYVKNSGYVNYFFIFWGFVIWRFCTVAADMMLSFWATKRHVFGHNLTDIQYLYIYGSAVWSSFIFMAFRQMAFVRGIVRAARISHDELVNSIIGAPTSFFDTTPLGRLINRFSKDVEAMDLVIPEVLNMFYNMILVMIGAIATMCFGAPYMAILVALLGGCFYVVVQYYSATNRALKRLEGINRSPVLAVMSESMGGLTTLRAYGIVPNFSKNHIGKLIISSRTTNSWLCAQRWLNLRVDTMGFGLNLGMSFLIVILLCYAYDVQSRAQNFSFMSLAITTSLAIGPALAFMATMSADLEASMSSVERVQEYVEQVPQERAVVYRRDDTDDEAAKRAEALVHFSYAPHLPESWPNTGAISFKNVELRYRDGLPLVLKGISVDITAGHKVGIVGRTGSGKSTIMLALFRLIELAGGRIEIDGVNIANVDIPDLRSHITIIPQDPLLFEGTIRSNLDPFNTQGDENIKKALKTVGMLNVIEDKTKSSTKAQVPAMEVSSSNVPDPLDCVVDERGSNFSVGQRQLLCLARALMKKSRILLLDEATASVDFESDELIQHTVRTEFADCTVLTIAHRLQTVMDADRILVLRNGEVAEYDDPRKLLSDVNGLLYDMVHSLGDDQFELLKAKTKTPQVG